jgi:hypothetical protein
LPASIVPGAVRHDPGVSRFALPALFSLLTLSFAAIAVSSANHGRWVIAIASVAITVWMGSFALASLRRTRR